LSVGFVLINAASRLEHAVYNTLLKKPEIIELHPLFGEKDIIVSIEAESFEKLGEIVTKKTRAIKGVIDTKTLTGTRL
jgi:DNA-binding Lrp family transcriptional regulator